MIQTAKGIIDSNEIGITLTDEHIICESIGANYTITLQSVSKELIRHLKG